MFVGSTAAAAGAGLGICTGIALAWILSNESLSATWEQTARTFARVAFVLLVVTIVYGLAAGILTVLLYRSEAEQEFYNRLYQIQGWGMLFVRILSLPCLLTGIWYAVRRSWSQAGYGLAFFGPVLVFILGAGLTPYLEIPWHQLVHTLFGALPLAVLYTLALRKWNPPINRFRSRGAEHPVSTT